MGRLVEHPSPARADRLRAAVNAIGERGQEKQLEEELRADEAACHRSDRSADQETEHAGIVAVAAIAFDVRAEKSACEEPADAADDGADDDARCRSCANS